jgi:hypothetical protein
LSNQSLHIVSFDVPFPADYGGAIDVYYRIKALHELGVKITLHCYEYGRGNPKELEEITEKVYYYPRKKRMLDGLSKLPFIIQTRRSNALMNRLLEDDSPILFEGLHTTFFLTDERLSERVKIVRTHNIEHHYYGHLAANSSGIKRRFFANEAKKLEKYEPVLKAANHILAISSTDESHFSHYGTNIRVLPPCYEQKDSFSQKSTEFYVLFHGNLSVSENALSAKWLAEKIFPIDGVRFIIAGKDPGKELLALKNDWVDVIANPSRQKMHALISDARVHALHTHQSTGVKLKLIQSLQTSGHVVVNSKMVEGTELSAYCSVVESSNEWKSSIANFLKHELDSSAFDKRLKLFEEGLNAKKNCAVLLDLMKG